MLDNTEISDLAVYFHRQRSGVLEGVPLYSIMRDEKYFLPHFLAYYRGLGVKSFIVFADKCDDEFMAMLEAEEDVSVMMSKKYSFGDVIGTALNGAPERFTSRLKTVISNSYLRGRWHLVADSDEFIVLPPPISSIDEYVEYLETQGTSYSFATMVDFYPQFLKQRNFEWQMDPFSGSPYFDKGPYHKVDFATGRIVAVQDGVRGRLLRYIQRHFGDTLKKSGRNIANYPGGMIYKFPVMKTSEQTQRNGDHRILLGARLPVLGNSCAIAHFKFYPELDNKLAVALGEGGYWNSSLEYQWLNFAVQEMSDVDLLWPNSVRYSQPQDFVDGKVMTSASRKSV